jgi:hypothetical protein
MNSRDRKYMGNMQNKAEKMKSKYSTNINPTCGWIQRHGII